MGVGHLGHVKATTVKAVSLAVHMVAPTTPSISNKPPTGTTTPAPGSSLSSNRLPIALVSEDHNSDFQGRSSGNAYGNELSLDDLLVDLCLLDLHGEQSNDEVTQADRDEDNQFYNDLAL